MHIGLGEIRERVGILEGRAQGSNGGQRGAVYRQPGTEVDDSCHNWRVPSKYKRGLARGIVARGTCICRYITKA